jgi:hypothetical protein
VKVPALDGSSRDGRGLKVPAPDGSPRDGRGVKVPAPDGAPYDGMGPPTPESLRRLGVALALTMGELSCWWLGTEKPLPDALIVAVMLLVAVMVLVGASCEAAGGDSAALLDADALAAAPGTGLLAPLLAGSVADVVGRGEGGGAAPALTAGAETPEALPVGLLVAVIVPVMLLVAVIVPVGLLVAVMLAVAASSGAPTDAPARAASASSATAERTNGALIAGGAAGGRGGLFDVGGPAMSGEVRGRGRGEV